MSGWDEEILQGLLHSVVMSPACMKAHRPARSMLNPFIKILELLPRQSATQVATDTMNCWFPTSGDDHRLKMNGPDYDYHTAHVNHGHVRIWFSSWTQSTENNSFGFCAVPTTSSRSDDSKIQRSLLESMALKYPDSWRWPLASRKSRSKLANPAIAEAYWVPFPCHGVRPGAVRCGWHLFISIWSGTPQTKKNNSEQMSFYKFFQTNGLSFSRAVAINLPASRWLIERPT